MAKGVRRGKKKTQVDANGIAHIKATFNNVIVTLTDVYGNTISWSSAGKMVLKVQEKTHPLLPRFLRKELLKKRML